MAYIKRKQFVRRRKPKSLLGLLGFGDPVTDPSQVDDTVVVGEVPPTRLTCDQLSADSPFRNPGQVCAPPDPSESISGFLTGLLDRIKGAVAPASATSTTDVSSAAAAVTPDPGTGSLLLLALVGGAAYYYFVHKKKRSA
jgi:hypothetical protein